LPEPNPGPVGSKTLAQWKMVLRWGSGCTALCEKASAACVVTITCINFVATLNQNESTLAFMKKSRVMNLSTNPLFNYSRDKPEREHCS